MEQFMQKDIAVTELALCCFVAQGTGRAVHRNRPNHGLAFKCGGSCRYVFEDGRRITVRPGDIIFLPKGSGYQVTDLEPGDCYAINFQLIHEPQAQPFVLHTRDSRRFARLFADAEAHWKNKAAGYRLKCRALLYEILYCLQSEHSMGYAGSEKFRRIRPAVEYLHKNYTTEPLRIEQLAAMCGMTPEYFRQIFRMQFGTSPLKYIGDLKIRRAEELLRSGMYSVTEAALLSGFGDISLFSREFKKATGRSPTECKAGK